MNTEMNTEEAIEIEELTSAEEVATDVDTDDEFAVQPTETEGMELADEIVGDRVQEAVDFSEASQLDFSDVEDDVECPFSLELRQKVIEAVLFVSDKPVGLSTLVAAFGDDVKDMRKAHVREALEILEEDLKDSDRGFRLHLVNGGYQLRTAEDLKDFLQNTIKARSFRLTGPSLETLAMVAYKQPCTKAQIDEIRGVESSHLIRALMDRNLLSFDGKSELPGKPMLYKTTSKFLEVFGLRNIKELPSLAEIEALLPDGIGDEEEEKESLSELAGKLGEEFEGSYSANEEELGKINDQLSAISTETEFFEQEKQREKDRKELEKAEDLREALMVGEEISVRDQNWLVRYDEKMNAETATEETVEESIEGEAAESMGMVSTDDVETGLEATEIEKEIEVEMSEEDLAELEAQKLIAAEVDSTEGTDDRETSFDEDFEASTKETEL